MALHTRTKARATARASRKTRAKLEASHGTQPDNESLRHKSLTDAVLPSSGFNTTLPRNKRETKWDLTERENAFCHAWVESGNMDRACIVAGVRDDTGESYLAKERCAKYIEHLLISRLSIGAVVGYNAVLDVAKSGSEGHRLKAGMWLFDKLENKFLRDAGILEQNSKIPGNKDELLAEAETILKSLNVNINVELPKEEKVIDHE